MSKRLSWAVRLARAKERGRFNDYEKGLATFWTQCAIGERHSFPSSRPALNSDERIEGMLFMHAVRDDDIPEAERIYALIQALPPVAS